MSGELMQSKHSSVKDKLDSAMSLLVESVYSKLSYVKKNYDSDADILNILNSPTSPYFIVIETKPLEKVPYGRSHEKK